MLKRTRVKDDLRNRSPARCRIKLYCFGPIIVPFGKLLPVLRPLIVLAAFFSLSIGYLTAQTDSSITDIPCRVETDGRDGKLTAGAFAKDADAARAEKKAALLAREELAGSVGELAKRFADAYTEIRENNVGEDNVRTGTYFSVYSELTAEALRGAEWFVKKRNTVLTAFTSLMQRSASPVRFLSNRAAAS